jgi:hypothetical protein
VNSKGPPEAIPAGFLLRRAPRAADRRGLHHVLRVEMARPENRYFELCGFMTTS